MTAWMQRAFDRLNARLFGGKLPPCRLEVSYHPRFEGSFTVHEGGAVVIQMRPTYGCSKRWLSTLAHEMAHYENHLAGGSGHDIGWRKIMSGIGLIPMQGVGDAFSHAIDADGLFGPVADELLAEGFAAPVFSLRDLLHQLEWGRFTRWLLAFNTAGLSALSAVLVVSVLSGQPNVAAITTVLLASIYLGLAVAWESARGRLRPIHDPELTGDFA